MRACALLLVLALPRAAHATWSITAVDPDTEQVGIAGATCGPFVWGIAGLAPGQGSVAAQYDTWGTGRDEATARLAEGESPEEVITAVTAASFDSDASWRQYGVVALGAPPAVFTGADVEPPWLALTGDTFSAQGNTLASEAVVLAAFDSYLADADLDLAERLLRALEAGAAQGGDHRCDVDQAARSAFLYVADPGDDPKAPRLELRVSSFLNGDPAVERLRADYEGELGCAAVPRREALGSLGLLALAIGLARRRPRAGQGAARPPAADPCPPDSNTSGTHGG
ncbi:MAG: DUF1028 domain-containing protein [Pseudomonadota bacterium]